MASHTDNEMFLAIGTCTEGPEAMETASARSCIDSQ